MKQTKGRKTRDGAAVRRVQVMLDEETVERAKALGDGNLSIGLRKMAKEADMNEDSNEPRVFIRITGPHVARGHCGPRKYWDVGIHNAHTGKTLDLVPWNERCSLSEREAAAIAAEASEVTGFQVQSYRVETETASRLVKIEGRDPGAHGAPENQA